jgi:hypothetical protein
VIDAAPAATVTYTEALSRGGVRLGEMRALARAWQAGETTAAFAERVRADDVLGKATARTVHDYVWTFNHRFATPSDRPARHLRRLADPAAPRQVFDDVTFHYIAARDHLLRDFSLLRYWPAAREGRLSLSVDEARQFIWEAERDGRIQRPWSASVQKDMPARVLNALSDFSLLGHLRAGRRPFLAYRPADGTLVYLAHLLHDDGVTDASLAEHPAWALFGLERPDVWNRLDLLAGDGWFILQRAGQVVRLTWKYRNADEVVDALAGR